MPIVLQGFHQGVYQGIGRWLVGSFAHVSDMTLDIAGGGVNHWATKSKSKSKSKSKAKANTKLKAKASVKANAKESKSTK